MLEKIRTPVKQATGVFRKDGLKGLVRTYGWKFCLGFFMFYLVRDILLYIVLPWLAARGLIGLTK